MPNIQININSNCCKKLITKDKLCQDNIDINVNVVNRAPIEVATASAMDALLISSNVGKIYKFIGTTDANYTNGELYEVIFTEDPLGSFNVSFVDNNGGYLDYFEYSTDSGETWNYFNFGENPITGVGKIRLRTIGGGNDIYAIGTGGDLLSSALSLCAANAGETSDYILTQNSSIEFMVI